MKLSIVIPTYNERANIEKILREIFTLSFEDLSVIVVDDNSPDGTGLLIEDLMQYYPKLSVIHREKKEGLGPAYVAGFQKALGEGAELIMEMDADFSHHPRYIPHFILAAQKADVVLGSRYIHGGGIENWNITRRIISRLGNWYARFMLHLPIRDLTGGFKCYHRRVLESIDWQYVSSVGYNFQIETTYLAHQKGFFIQEIPIVFTERTTGKSKFHPTIILDSFWKVFLLGMKGLFGK